MIKCKKIAILIKYEGKPYIFSLQYASIQYGAMMDCQEVQSDFCKN